jgi:hypothetical protein
MIDDPKQVALLMQKLETHLPIPAHGTSALLKTLRDGKFKLSANQSLQIEKVMYFGDEGGISCVIKLPKTAETALVVSLTHLRLSNAHPLAAEVRAYQMARTKNLARGGRG